MKTVASALASALLKKSYKPVVQVKVDDRRNAGVSPTVWTSVYSTAISAVGHCACVVSGGYLMDFRLDTGAGDIYGRRTAVGSTPGSSWSKRAASVKTNAQFAVCSTGNTVYLFYVNSDEKTIKYKVSTDAGATFGSEATAVTLADGHICNSLAAVCPGYGLHDVILILSDSATGDTTTQDKDIKWAYYTAAGGWSAAATWGRTAGKTTFGLAAIAYDCDASHTEVTLVLAGRFETVSGGYNFNAYHVNINSSHAATWTYVCKIKQLDGSNFVAWPSMIAEDTYDRARVLFQYYDASLPAGKQWQSYQTFIYELLSGEDIQFGAWQTFRITNEAYMMGLSRSATGYIYAGIADSLWRTPVWDGSSKWYVDVSDSVLSLEHHIYDNALIEDIPFQPGFAYVFLDNHDGRFLNYGQSGATYEAIKRGAQVHFLVGYDTASGVELEALPPMWIDRIFHGQNPRSGASQDVPHLTVEGGPLLGGRYLILKCYDPWTMTARMGPTPNSWTFSNTKCRKILSQVFMQMGIYYSDDGTSRLDVSDVTWTAQAGRPWYSLIRDILLYCHCRLKFYVEYDKVSGGRPAARAYVFADKDIDPVDLSVGGTGQLTLYAGMYWEQDRWGGYQYEWYEPAFIPTTILEAGAFCGAAVEGKGAADHDIDFDRVEAMGYWQPRPVVDYQVTDTSTVTAEMRAEAASDEEPLYCGQVLIPLHPCLEVWDRVQVSDSGACQAVQKRFVIGVESFYDVKGKRGRFEQVVHLMRHVRS